MTGLAKIYPVATKICLEFAKMGQSTDKNKLQLSLSINFGVMHMRTTIHDLRTVLALELFEDAFNSRNNDQQKVSLLHK